METGFYIVIVIANMSVCHELRELENFTSDGEKHGTKRTSKELFETQAGDICSIKRANGICANTIVKINTRSRAPKIMREVSCKQNYKAQAQTSNKTSARNSTQEEGLSRPGSSHNGVERRARSNIGRDNIQLMLDIAKHGFESVVAVEPSRKNVFRHGGKLSSNGKLRK